MDKVFHDGDRIQVSDPGSWTNCKGEKGIVDRWVDGACYYVTLDSGRQVALMAKEMTNIGIERDRWDDMCVSPGK